MNREEKHQSRYDRGSTIISLAYVGLIVGLTLGGYYYADCLHKSPEQNKNGLEEIIHK